ncbi:hypothetical protein KFZ76_06895 [Methylovulum psychrotolerans]|uniref:hypothetical protein n=1 Tax=Methylovulum psychrotolerans TaxID=1704499 RepID=UPI001BFEFDE2|nr:hypothetical protein [Methylovulum psychrotolerans]MBT9097437.1 hypothetical protein [Methylovulum psychrotolerans]
MPTLNESYLIFLQLMAVGLFGGLANYTVQVVKGHVTCRFGEYLRGALSATVVSMGAIVSAALGAIKLGADLGDPATFMTMFMAGYVCDNVANKQEKKDA